MEETIVRSRLARLSAIVAIFVMLPTSVFGQAIIRWPMSRTASYDSGRNYIVLVAYTEDEFDSASTGQPGYPNLPEILARRQLTKFFADSLGREVSVITVKARNDTFALAKYKRRPVSFRLTSASAFGLVRDSLKIEAITSAHGIIVEPGKFDFIFVVFPRMEFHDNDVFYIELRDPQP